jgi:hypothetical protein
MSIERPTKCAHPACGCPTEKSSNYCSQSCKDAADLIEISCPCGHLGCTTEHR